jgi:hypothetical protein
VLTRRHVTHRIDIRSTPQVLTLEFEGLLDPAALRELRDAAARGTASGAAVRLVLRAGTEVERACVDELRALDAEVVAESAYLARWLGGEPR